MPSYWTWGERSRRIRFVIALCWLAYMFVVLGVIAFALPPVIIQIPLLFWAFIVLFVGPPAWINFVWVYFPGYLFSFTIRSLSFNDLISAQVSHHSNTYSGFGVPKLPTDLRTSIPRTVLTGLETGKGGFASTHVSWDEYLYVSSAIVFTGRKMPTRTCRATLEFGPEGLILTAGRWRPGLVLELPYSEIVGVWNGSDIKTIDSGGVLVVVVAAGQDEILFPFEVVRAKSGLNERRTVEVLISLVERCRQRHSGVPKRVSD